MKMDAGRAVISELASIPIQVEWMNKCRLRPSARVNVYKPLPPRSKVMIARRHSIPGRREAEAVNELLVSPKIVLAPLPQAKTHAWREQKVPPQGE